MGKNLLELPYIPLKKIFKHMKLLEIVDIAILGDAIRYSGTWSKTKVAEFKWLIMAPGHYVINVVPLDPDEERIVLRIGNCSTPFSEACINGKSAQAARRNRVITILCEQSDEEKIKIFNDLSAALLHIFDVQNFLLNSNIVANFVFNHQKKFNTIDLSCVSCDLKDFRRILEEIEVDCLKFDVREIYPRVDMEQFEFKHREIHINYATWISFSSFLKMSSEEVYLGEKHDLTTVYEMEDFMEFINSWIEGGMPNLKCFRVLPNSSIDKFRCKMLKELPKLDNVHIDRGYGIATGKDGKQARIDFDKDFIFTVLQE